MNYRPVKFSEVKNRTTFFERVRNFRTGAYEYVRIFRDKSRPEQEGVDNKLSYAFTAGATVYVRA